MKILLRFLAVCLTVTMVVVLSGAGPGEPADVIKGDWCAISTPYGWISDADFVEVSNSGGNMSLVCHASGLENTDGKVWKDRGFLCGTFSGLTNNTYKVVTPSGNVMMRCVIKKPKD